ncbi:MAG: gluconate 2-dehydrogenase subunit 3 family protein [Microbacteriaceae bacterium]
MTELPLDAANGGGRFPGFDVLAQAEQWDRATQATVGSRLGMLPAIRFFTPEEEATAGALFDQLLYQREDPRVPVVQMVDSRLADGKTDGWHYDSMPTDAQAWRASLKGLDDDAGQRHGRRFVDCSWEEQTDILAAIHDLGQEDWHELAAGKVWGLWTRYACTAFYSHPWAWNEIGFAGPAYPRGYKNLGLDKREPFEVPDARPHDDPAAGDLEAKKTAGRPSSGVDSGGPAADSAKAGGT